MDQATLSTCQLPSKDASEGVGFDGVHEHVMWEPWAGLILLTAQI